MNPTRTRRLRLAFASVRPLNDDEDSCRQQSTISQSPEIRNGHSIRDRSPVEKISGTEVANENGQHLLEIRWRDKSRKIHDELEGIQERICSIIEEYEQLMKEENRLRRRSEDIKATTEIPNETTAKGEMTEDQKRVPHVATANPEFIRCYNGIDYLERIIGGEQAHIFRRHHLPAGLNQIWVRSGGSLVVEGRKIRYTCEVKPMQSDGSHRLLPKVGVKGCLKFNARYKDLGSYEFAYKILSVYNLIFSIMIIDLRRHGIDRSAGFEYMYVPTPPLENHPKESCTKFWWLKKLMGTLRGPKQFERSEDGMPIRVMSILRIPR